MYNELGNVEKMILGCTLFLGGLLIAQLYAADDIYSKLCLGLGFIIAVVGLGIILNLLCMPCSKNE